MKKIVSTSKNGFPSQKLVTLGKLSHSWKNGSHFQKRHAWEKGAVMYIDINTGPLHIVHFRCVTTIVDLVNVLFMFLGWPL